LTVDRNKSFKYLEAPSKKSRILDFWFRRVLKEIRRKKRASIKYLYTIRGDETFYTHRYFIERHFISVEREKGVRANSYTGTRIRDKKWLKRKIDIFDAGEDRRIFLPEFSIAGNYSECFSSISRTLRSKIENVYYLSAERGTIPWTLETLNLEKATWVGSKGQRTLEIIAKLMKPEYDNKRLPYEIFSEKFGIKHAWSGWEKTSVLTSNYIDPFLGSSHKFPSLGYGSRQLLPVIAQLGYCNQESIILVEEPEMSLHPAYQRLLPALFGRAVKESKQVIVTTHSSYFPLSLNIVLGGFQLQGRTTRGRRRYRIKLSVDDVAVYHVYRNKKGYTSLERLTVDEDGLKEGIPSFVDVEKEILERYMSRE